MEKRAKKYKLFHGVYCKYKLFCYLFFVLYIKERNFGIIKCRNILMISY